MAINLSVTARNGMLDAIETAAGTAAKLRIYTGTKPTACSDAATGTLLAEMTLDSDWMNAASTGTKTKLGTWQDASANADGTAGYFRIWDNAGTTCHMQGSVGTSGQDLNLDNTSIATGQSITINTFTLTAPNA